MEIRSCSRALFATSALLIVLGAALAGCGDDQREAGSTTSEPTTTEPTTTEETSTTAAGGEKPEPTGEVDESDTPPWQRTALPYRDRVGETVEIECTPDGEAFPVWGTNAYTDDSSVCTAAVQVGLITFEEGGTVTIEIGGPADEFTGSTNNEVESSDYGSWGGSFTFPEAEEIEVAEGIAWDRVANTYADQGEGEEITVVCRPEGEPASVWGTGTYTDDSSICTAAVHAGLIGFEEGGEVTFKLTAGEESYQGSEANGVTSSDYGAWGGSFVFTDEP